MRRILHSDVTAAARALLRFPKSVRASAFQAMMVKAQAADLYRKRLGKMHPLWGNGSLMAVAGVTAGQEEPFLHDPSYLECLSTVIDGLISRYQGGSQPPARF